MKYLILILLISNTTFAREMACSHLFNPYKPTEAEIDDAILEYYNLRKDIYSSDKTISNVARSTSKRKLSELKQYISQEEIVERLKSIDLKDDQQGQAVAVKRNDDLDAILLHLAAAESFIEMQNISADKWLSVAIDQRRFKLIPALIHLGAVDKPDRSGFTGLMEMVGTGDTVAVRALAKLSQTLNNMSNWGATALNYANGEKNLSTRNKMIKILVDAGINDIQLRNEYKNTSLIENVKEGNVEGVRILATLKDSINLKDTGDFNALSHTTSIKDLTTRNEIIKILVEAGAVDTQSHRDYDNTTLIKNVIEGNVEGVRILATLKDSINLKDTGEFNALNKTTSIVDFTTRNEIIKILLEAGAVDTQSPRDYLQTTLMKNVKEGNIEGVRLLSKLPSINARAKNNKTALSMATDPQIREILIQAGAKE